MNLGPGQLVATPKIKKIIIIMERRKEGGKQKRKGGLKLNPSKFQ